jgi:hypothetical protein
MGHLPGVWSALVSTGSIWVAGKGSRSHGEPDAMTVDHAFLRAIGPLVGAKNSNKTLI